MPQCPENYMLLHFFAVPDGMMISLLNVTGEILMNFGPIKIEVFKWCHFDLLSEIHWGGLQCNIRRLEWVQRQETLDVWTAIH